MKNVKISIALLLIYTFIFSCSKNDKLGYGQPSIYRVEQPTDSTNISAGSFEQWIKIYGVNLATTQTVALNDQVVGDSLFYANDTTITLQIPRAIPQNVNNTLTVVTKGGTTTYSFVVNVPALEFTGMFNEYTPIGDTMTLVGKNFDLYDFKPDSSSVIFTGGAVAKVLSVTPTAIKLIVPAGAKEGPVIIQGSAPINAKDTSSAWYMDSRNLLFGMDPFTGWNGASYLSDGPNPISINGTYFHVAKPWQGGYAWDPFCSNNCAIPGELVADPALYKNYAVKFEFYTPASGNTMPLSLYMCFNSGDFREYFYDIGNGSYPFSTGGKWETFTVPLKNWSLDGFVFSSSMIMEFMLKDANPSVSDFSICNFRIVPL